MQPSEIEVPDKLRPAIQGFWHLSLNFDELPTGYEVLPDSHAEIIFSVGRPCYLATAQGWQALPSPFLVGLLSQPVVLRAQGRVDILGIHCLPWAVSELLGLPARLACAAWPILLPGCRLRWQSWFGRAGYPRPSRR